MAKFKDVIPEIGSTFIWEGIVFTVVSNEGKDYMPERYWDGGILGGLILPAHEYQKYLYRIDNDRGAYSLDTAASAGIRGRRNRYKAYKAFCDEYEKALNS